MDIPAPVPNSPIIKKGTLLIFPFSSIVTTEPLVLDLYEFKLSTKFLLNALWIGMIELRSGINRPKTIAIIVD